ncbi:alkylation response protein AidB-like acyl-CoA dehydrogenase [Pseudonocardia kunmingensis]|uniref:Alkylation response protein AidB-like acyl-CoA dehydrogenase n=2 Tax=Pseudonocardia kunmingensis TaxID=630975 RepID=A0A543DPJ2_9PSEU|nr:alkylation response protein AidB-like acyl-CoA dehydrogenase [Pseudonocardia kunmingensis]
MTSALLEELRRFVDAELAAFRRDWPDVSTWEARCAWQRRMAREGWAAPRWPVEYGGRGLGTLEAMAVEDVFAEKGCPVLPGMLGLKNVGPTLQAHGTDEQKRHLAAILSIDEVWCQGFSEPGAGSDLAGLRTRAVRDGDDFVVNGQKIWTSNGIYATHMQLLVRTDPQAPKHRGISVLLVDMATPGVEVRPIRQINGGAEFAEVFFTDVRVPVANLLGPLNDGWRITMTTLGHERAGVATFAARLEQRTVDLLEANRADTRTEPLGPGLRDELLDGYVDARVLGLLGRQMLERLAGGQQPGPEQSVIKLVHSEVSQRVESVQMAIAGAAAVRGEDPAAAHAYLSARSATIAAGTTQIVKNIIAERVLALPRNG